MELCFRTMMGKVREKLLSLLYDDIKYFVASKFRVLTLFCNCTFAWTKIRSFTCFLLRFIRHEDKLYQKFLQYIHIYYVTNKLSLINITEELNMVFSMDGHNCFWTFNSITSVLFNQIKIDKNMKVWKGNNLFDNFKYVNKTTSNMKTKCYVSTCYLMFWQWI